MVIDCHFHLDYDSITIDKLLQSMDGAGVNKTALMASLSAPFPDPPSFLVNMFRFLLTHRAFRKIGELFSSNFTPEGDLKLPRGSVHIYPDPDNEPVFSMVEKHQDRFLGWVFVNPKGSNDQAAELERWMDRKGFVGVKGHPFWHQYAPVDLVPVARMLEYLQKPLLLHVGYGEHGDYTALLKEVPGLKLILAHAGFPLYEDTWEAIRMRKNIFVDLSQTIYVSEKLIKREFASLRILKKRQVLK